MKDLIKIPGFILLIVLGVFVMMGGIVAIASLIDNYQNPITIFKVTKEISVLKEQKDCEAKGGKFEIIDGRDFFFLKKEDMFDYKLECKKPRTGGETIFSKEIKLN